MLTIGCRSGANINDVVGAVRDRLPTLSQGLPSSVQVHAFGPGDPHIIICQAQVPQGISAAAMSQTLRALEDVMRGDPDVESYVSMTPPSFAPSGRSDVAVLLARLRTPSSGSVAQVVEKLRPRAQGIPGLRVRMRPATQPVFHYTLQGHDIEELHRVSEEFLATLRLSEALRNVDSDLAMVGPAVNIQIDRERAGLLCVSIHDIADCVRLAFGGIDIPSGIVPGNQDTIILEMQGEREAVSLDTIRVRADSGEAVPLAAVVQLTGARLEPVIRHTGLLPSVRLSWTLKPGMRKAEGRALVERMAEGVLPAGIAGHWTD